MEPNCMSAMAGVALPRKFINNIVLRGLAATIILATLSSFVSTTDGFASPVAAKAKSQKPKTNTSAKPVARTSWTIGHSVKHRPIIVYRFGKGRDTTAILGVFHGNEPGGKAVCEQLIKYLQKHPEAYSLRTVLVVPVVNPDGLAARSRLNARQVDINRNWPLHWQRVSRLNPHPGASAFSEPEVRAVRDLLAQYHPSKVINLHQYKNMLNPTSAHGVALAREMAKHNHLRVDTSIGYPTPGSFGDYCGLRLKMAMVTYEMPGGSSLWSKAGPALLSAIKFRVPGK